MTAQELSALAGTVLSLVLAYTPGLKDAYDKLASPQKALTMALLLLVSAVGAVAWSCRAADAGFVQCLAANWENYLWAFVAALIANQSTYSLLVRRIKK